MIAEGRWEEGRVVLGKVEICPVFTSRDVFPSQMTPSPGQTRELDEVTYATHSHLAKDSVEEVQGGFVISQLETSVSSANQ